MDHRATPGPPVPIERRELVTVVVPVYQVSRWLRRCLDSILSQSYSSLQIILVDDGSTDGSGEICDDYSARDSRVEVIHQDNRGLAAARNLGVEVARGEWLTFIDSDDWVHTDFIAQLHELTCHGVDIAMCDLARVSDAGDVPDDQNNRSPHLWDTEEALRAFLGPRHTSMTIACAKLIRRRLFDDVTFPVGRLHEDEFTTYRLIANAASAAFTERRLYYYFQNPKGITGGGLSARHRRDLVDAYAERVQFLERGDFSLFAPAARGQLLRKQLQLHRSLRGRAHAAQRSQLTAQIRRTVHQMDRSGSSTGDALLGHAFLLAPPVVSRIYDYTSRRRGGRARVSRSS